MKELQNFVYRHMDALKHHKRYLAMLTALSMLVTFIVPLILMEPADSMTKQKLMLLSDSTGSSYPTSFSENISGKADNMVPNAAGTDGNGANGNQVGDVIYSPAQMDILTLLFGAANDSNGNLTHQSLYAGCSTIEDALEVDKETYFLGYASDFCAFIEGDFTATEADAEGRVAVGGNLNFTNGWNYQIGSGDFEKAKSLQTIEKYKEYKNEYDNIYGFASALVGGDMYRINTLSTGKKENNSDSTRHINPGNNTVYYNPNDGLYKSFVISSADTSGFLHYDEPNSSDIAYGDGCKHDFPSDKCTNCTNHNHLNSINELSQLYVYPSVRELIQDTFEYVRSRSEVLSHMQSIPGNADIANKKVIFDATGKVSNNVKTVYFSLPSWSADYKEIEFKGIPDGANIVVNCAETGTVYISGSSEDKNKDLQGDWDIKTTLNNTVISIKGMNDSDYKGKNNHPYSSRILYNFYNTNEIHINGSFNGTVLAPNADAESADKGCAGHLSGALIAKSFYGGLEFGYRPYRAGSDILGMTSGYEVPVDKLIANTTTLLPGAIFEIAEVLLDENGEEILDNGERIEQVMSLFESGNSTKYVALPSYIDFSGNTTYIGTSTKSEIVDVDKTESFNNVGTIYSDLVITVSKDQNQNDILTSPIIVNSGTVLYLKANHQVNWTEPTKNDNNFNFDYVDNYTRKLTINNDNENTLKFIASINNSLSKEVVINVNPVVLNVSPTEINWGDELKFTHSGYDTGYLYQYSITNLPNNTFETKESEYTIAYTYNQTGDNVPIKLIVRRGDWAEVKQVEYNIKVNKPELNLSEECYKDASVNMSLSFTPADCSVEYYQVDSYGNNNTQYINGTQFNPSAIGTYNIRAKITKNNQSIYTDIKTITVVEKLEPYLSVSSNSVNVNETITFEVKNLPNDVTINNCIVNDQTISSENGVYQFAPTQAGEYTITVTLSDGVTLTETIKANDLSDLYIGLNSDTYVSGQEAIFTLYNYPENVGITWEIFYWDTDNSRNDWTQITPNQGHYEVNGNQLKITFAKNTPHKVVVYFNGNEAISKEVVVEDQTRMLSARSTINYLADETVQIAALSDNKFVLVSPNGEPIIKANLNLQSDNDYTIKYACYSGNDEKANGQAVKSEINNGNYAITCEAEKNITKIEIEVTTGYVTLNSGNLTYKSEATKTTHMSPYTSTPDGEKKYSLDIPANMQQLDSVTFKLAPNASAGEIGIKCWVKYSGADNLQEMPNCKFTNGVCTISGFTNNVEKIIIQNLTADSELPIDSYSYIATTDGDIADSETHRDIIEKHKYIIREAKAPQGYYKTDDYYEVTITEKLNTADVDNDTIPLKVDTIIDIDYVELQKDNNGTVTEKTSNYYDTSLTVRYGVKDKTDGSGEKEADLNTRIIKIGEETFTIIKNAEGEITSVKASNNDSELSYTVTNENENTTVELKDSKATDFTYNNKKYYYNPETMMIIPLPLGYESEKNLTFSNERGLLFKKIDDSGAMVNGATIKVTIENGEVEFTDSSKVLRLGDFEPEKKYTFTEKTTPSGYETAKPIHFMLNSDKSGVKWWSEGDEEPVEYTSISEAVIEMVDFKITGAKLTLKKVDDDGKAITNLATNPATFNLYAENGTSEGVLIKEDINVNNVNGIDVDLSTGVTELGKAYVDKKYLKPGYYYLVEKDAPNGYKKQTGNIRFVVQSDYKLSFIDVEPPNLQLATKDVTGGKWEYVVIANGRQLNVENPGTDNPNKEIGIPNAQTVHVTANPAFPEYWFTNENGVTMGTSGGNFSELTVTYQNPIQLDKVKFYGPEGIQFTITITTSDGRVYKYFSTENLEKLEVLEVENEKDNGLMDVPVQKIWVNDSPFAQFRPNVTLKLYRTTTEITDEQRMDPASIEGDPVPITYIDDEGHIVEKTDEFATLILNKSNAVTNNPNTWEGEFKDIKEKDATGNPYYFYIMEESVSMGYQLVSTGAYSKTENGILTVSNEPLPASVNAKKVWENDSTNSGIIPENITLKLQVRIEIDENGNPLEPANYTWQDVEGKTLTVSSSVNWAGSISGLLRGKTYRLTENGVLGWTIKDDSQNIVSIDMNTGLASELSITNVPRAADLGDLLVQKLWDTTEGIPDSIKFKLYRKTLYGTYPQGQPLLRTDNDGGVSVQDDYARLLQYSLYFYDGLMCGNDVSETSAYAWRDDCHVDNPETAAIEYDGITPGGFHDAGDHVMFGLPAGFSASSLGWSLYEFRTKYDELGQTAHSKVITDYYADFFSRCIRTKDGTKEILVQKGHGNTDHAFWGIPEGQPEEKYKKDDVEYWRSGTGADIAAEYAAALALSYLNFYDTTKGENEDENPKYKGYLDKAKEFYDYAVSVQDNPAKDASADQNGTPTKGSLNEWNVNLDETQTSKSFPGYYKSDDCQDDLAWAAAWLSLASTKSNDTTAAAVYDGNCETHLGNIKHDWGGYNWNSVKHGAALVNAAYLNGNWASVQKLITDYYDHNYYESISEWGCSRYNAGVQTIALIAAKHKRENNAAIDIDVNQAIQWSQKQMDFILGGNQFNTCFVTGFAENSVKRPHFRAGSGQVFDMQVKDDTTVIDSYDDTNILLGGLVGGPKGDGNYEDKRSDYMLNEVASDYNAVLVNAAAGLYYFYGTGETFRIPGVEIQYLPEQEEQIPQIDGEAEQLLSDILTAYSVKQTRVSLLADITDDTTNNCIIVVLNNEGFGDKIEIPECENKTITSIELVFNQTLTSGSGFQVAYAPNGSRFQNPTSHSGSTLTFTESLDSPVWIEVYNYSGQNVTLSEIRMRYSSGNTPITPTLTIDKASINLSNNETANLTVNPSNATLSYEQNNLQIDDLGNGNYKITGKTTGNHTITATLNGQTASVDINVTENSSSGGNTNATPEVTTLDNYTVHKWETNGDNWSWTSLGVDEGERVVKVEIRLESNNGNNIGRFNGGMGTDGLSLKADKSGTEWYQENLYVDNISSTQHTFTWNIPENQSRDINYTKFLKFGLWDNEMSNVNVKSITIYTVVEASIIGVPSDGLMYGQYVQLGTKGLTEPIEWSVSDNDAAEFDEKVNGKLIAKNVESDTDVTITAKDANGNETIAVIKIKPFTLSFNSSSSDFKVREGNEITIPFNTEETVTITFTDNEFVTHSGNTFTGIKSSNETKYDFTANCNNSQITGTIEVLPEFQITSEDLVYNGETLNLTANGISGVNWEIVSGGECASLNGNKLTGLKYGNVVIRATDTTDGSTTTQTIAVKLKAVNPGFDYEDNEFKLVGEYTITDGTETPGTTDDDWKLKIRDLPIADSQGNYYVYYIVECNSNGGILDESGSIQGENTMFVPTEYVNGVTLVNDAQNPSQVSVKNSLSGRVQGQLPSTGGSGVTTYYYLGGVIMLLSIAGFTGLKRREKKRRKE